MLFNLRLDEPCAWAAISCAVLVNQRSAFERHSKLLNLSPEKTALFVICVSCPFKPWIILSDAVPVLPDHFIRTRQDQLVQCPDQKPRVQRLFSAYHFSFSELFRGHSALDALSRTDGN